MAAAAERRGSCSAILYKKKKNSKQLHWDEDYLAVNVDTIPGYRINFAISRCTFPCQLFNLD